MLTAAVDHVGLDIMDFWAAVNSIMSVSSPPALALPLSFCGLAGDLPNVSEPHEMHDTCEP